MRRIINYNGISNIYIEYAGKYNFYTIMQIILFFRFINSKHYIIITILNWS